MAEGLDFSGITACGENCTGCAKKTRGLCRGCRETDGRCEEWKGSGRCPVHACASSHRVLFCGLCEAFPCEKLPGLMPWNPHAKEHLASLAQLYRSTAGVGEECPGCMEKKTEFFP